MGFPEMYRGLYPVTMHILRKKEILLQMAVNRSVDLLTDTGDERTSFGLINLYVSQFCAASSLGTTSIMQFFKAPYSIFQHFEFWVPFYSSRNKTVF